MERKSLLLILFPAVCMDAAALPAFAFPHSALFGLFEVSMMLLFPFLFVVQGILCAVYRIHFPLALVVSLADFALLALLFMNDSAFGILWVYAAAALSGWTAIRLLRLRKDWSWWRR